MLLKSNEEIIKTWAEKLKANAEYEIGKSDLNSLEPCDAFLMRYRRMKKSQELLSKEQKLEELFRLIDKQTGEDDQVMLLNPGKEITEAQWAFYSGIYNIYIYIYIIIEYLDGLKRGYELYDSCPKNMKEVFIHKLIGYSISAANHKLLKMNDKLFKGKLYNLWDRYKYDRPLGVCDDFEVDPKNSNYM